MHGSQRQWEQCGSCLRSSTDTHLGLLGQFIKDSFGGSVLSVVQFGHKLSVFLPASASKVPGLKVCVTAPSSASVSERHHHSICMPCAPLLLFLLFSFSGGVLVKQQNIITEVQSGACSLPPCTQPCRASYSLCSHQHPTSVVPACDSP